MSDIKFIQKYESDGKGNSSLISKEELVQAIESNLNQQQLSLEEQEVVNASVAYQLSIEEAKKLQAGE